MAILLAGWLGSLSQTHFDGVLDLHSGHEAPLGLFLAEGFINWFCMSAVVLIAGRCFSETAFRTIDVVGTQALARWPTVLMSLACLPEGYQRYGQHLLSLLSKPGQTPSLHGQGADAVVFFLVVAAILLLTGWMVALMYQAFSLSCNLRGGKAIGVFIGSLLIAEILSKVAIGLLFRSL